MRIELTTLLLVLAPFTGTLFASADEPDPYVGGTNESLSASDEDASQGTIDEPAVSEDRDTRKVEAPARDGARPIPAGMRVVTLDAGRLAAGNERAWAPIRPGDRVDLMTRADERAKPTVVAKQLEVFAASPDRGGWPPPESRTYSLLVTPEFAQQALKLVRERTGLFLMVAERAEPTSSPAAAANDDRAWAGGVFRANSVEETLPPDRRKLSLAAVEVESSIPGENRPITPGDLVRLTVVNEQGTPVIRPYDWLYVAAVDEGPRGAGEKVRTFTLHVSKAQHDSLLEQKLDPGRVQVQRLSRRGNRTSRADAMARTVVVYRLRHVDGNDVVKTLAAIDESILSKTDGHSDAILVRGDAATQRWVAALVRALDVSAAASTEVVAVYDVKLSDADAVAKTIRAVDPQLTVEADRPANRVLVRGDAATQRWVAALVRAVEKPAELPGRTRSDPPAAADPLVDPPRPFARDKAEPIKLTVTVDEGATRIVNLPEAAKRIDHADPKVQVQVVDGTTLLLVGRKPGTAIVVAVLPDERRIEIDVVVNDGRIGELDTLLSKLYPAARLQLHVVRDAILVRGSVESAEEVDQIVRIAEQFFPKVLDQLTVTGKEKTSGGARSGLGSSSRIPWHPSLPRAAAGDPDVTSDEITRAMREFDTRLKARDWPGALDVATRRFPPADVARAIEVVAWRRQRDEENREPAAHEVDEEARPQGGLDPFATDSKPLPPEARLSVVEELRSLRREVKALRADVQRVLDRLDQGDTKSDEDTSSLDAEGAREIAVLVREELAMGLEEVDPTTLPEMSLYHGAVRVTGTMLGGRAADVGIKQGDLLVGLGVWETRSLQNVAFALHELRKRGETRVKFHLLRERGDEWETLFGSLPLARDTATARTRPPADPSKSLVITLLPENIRLHVGEQHLFPLTQPADDVEIGDRRIAAVDDRNETHLVLRGVKPGRTTLTLGREGLDETVTFRIQVVAAPFPQDSLDPAVPGISVDASPMSSQAVEPR